MIIEDCSQFKFNVCIYLCSVMHISSIEVIFDVLWRDHRLVVLSCSLDRMYTLYLFHWFWRSFFLIVISLFFFLVLQIKYS
jgi:hypothetical protein